jgi:hypothetical protein
MAFPRGASSWISEQETLLFDLQRDYGQKAPLHDRAQEAAIIPRLVAAMAASDAPPEQYQRLELPAPDCCDGAAALAACRTT